MGEICIDPEGAKQAGTAISADSNEARTRLEAQFDEIAPAAAANEGWKTGQALVDFAYVRKNDILSALQELDSVGQKIVETVTAKKAVDERYADSLTRIGKATNALSE
ncbi:hypothetical protein [Nocardia mexicana]|uniref:Excreted virulence factor EspC (Type VII ESX diderm) n=1 Tax=Nocardia mexicana TaxID=279262 RepID=A0A370HC85_9NOCA|nr:hypothetical protein [Nocardia mexicana]RDI54101.1 hypothetical protein DFR68_102225 [Nocardia mexicana]